ncbi:nitrate reductase molybdenum cofactor assembly chaperone [Agromyces atrinae]|uniref:nitrate reductase molybdenum cofactor assembly chaperone n=1 Tax=Agromyces atrinae TaxID=592376 RepID=UPI001F591663|nr:nitrate reductase molybdenum cofactor assembly chaperone [Agromyces atrinae]MCI2957721.1 nitrate reductase molybdenum cofactor assembly chaperone [Agromyces atrinae]
MKFTMPPQISLKRMPAPIERLELSRDERSLAHMLASLLLDYPDAAYLERLPELASSIDELPDAIAAPFRSFIAHAMSEQERLAPAYVTTFDLKRKSCLYLTYFAAGDTRRRGTALVTFLEAYRAAGWEFEADELPDYLPAVLEFSAVTDSPVAARLLAAHRDGIEVLRAALLAQSSPWASLVEAVCLSLPEIDDETRERYLALINDGPPTETVGISFLGQLEPFSAGGGASREVRV